MLTDLKRATSPSMGVTFVRIILGVIMFAHGAQKVMGWFGGSGLEATAGHFARGIGVSTPLFYIAAFTEFFGGIALILGVLSRFFGLGILIEMFVAMIKVHIPVGFFMNWGSTAGRGEGFEYNLALLAMSGLIVLAGPGLLAVGDWEPRILGKLFPHAENRFHPRLQTR
ncbi:MAG: DoxX family protein [Ignavibacteria bacterium]|nr:MAG: DoxX family protein [Ignavibacteria bacterium]